MITVGSVPIHLTDERIEHIENHLYLDKEVKLQSSMSAMIFG